LEACQLSSLKKENREDESRGDYSTEGRKQPGDSIIDRDSNYRKRKGKSHNVPSNASGVVTERGGVYPSLAKHE